MRTVPIGIRDGRDARPAHRLGRAAFLGDAESIPAEPLAPAEGAAGFGVEVGVGIFGHGALGNEEGWLEMSLGATFVGLAMGGYVISSLDRDVLEREETCAQK